MNLKYGHPIEYRMNTQVTNAGNVESQEETVTAGSRSEAVETLKRQHEAAGRVLIRVSVIKATAIK